MKSGLACALVAIEAIVRSGVKLAGDISFGGVVGEIEKTAIEEFQPETFKAFMVAETARQAELAKLSGHRK